MGHMFLSVEEQPVWWSGRVVMVTASAVITPAQPLNGSKRVRSGVTSNRSKASLHLAAPHGSGACGSGGASAGQVHAIREGHALLPALVLQAWAKPRLDAQLRVSTFLCQALLCLTWIPGQVVQALAKHRLLGDGDVLRLLGTQGYRLKHAQDPRMELDLSVTALATDLRSGVRLCRLVETLAGITFSI